MSTRIILCLCLVGSQVAFAQVEDDETMIPKVRSSIDLTGSVGPETFGASLGYSRTHGLLKSKKLRLGYGVRLSGIAGSDLTYISAPLRLTQDPATIDTLRIGHPANFALTAVIHLGYMFNEKWEVGFNIDAVGFGFGRNNIATFESSENDGSYPRSVRAQPTPLSLLLVGDNDIGYLKSEFVIGYSPTEKLRIKVGADYTFSEYTTVQELTNENDRFRYKAFMGYVGVSYFIEG